MIIHCRKIAANRLFVHGKALVMYVVELKGKNVIDYYPLNNREMPYTEWVGGTLHIKLFQGNMYVYKDGVMLTE